MTILRCVLFVLLAALHAAAQAPAPAKSANVSKSEPVDINTATAEELKRVPGIGEAYAAKIIAGRPYRAKNELVDRKIMPAGVYAKVKNGIVAKGKK